MNVRSAECIDPHYFAVLIGCGATTVNAYLAEDTLADRIERGLLEGSLTEAVARYRNAIDQGLLKIMAKMGISVISSYRGGLNFEAVGLSRAMVAEYFPGMISASPASVSLGIQQKAEEVHAKGWAGSALVLPIGGFYKARSTGETHAWEATSMHMMQMACNKASYELWKQYSAKMRAATRRSICGICWTSNPWASRCRLEEVESITSIRKRFVTPGMSLGALSARGAQDPERGHEPDRRQVRFRRGRGRPGAFPPRAQRRQPVGQDQAGGVGPFWCDGGISQPV